MAARGGGWSKRTVHYTPFEVMALTKAEPKVAHPGGERPRTRGECMNGPRPCPWVSCRHHLYLDVTSDGGIIERWPGLALEDMPETCSLDVADRGEASVEDIAAVLNVTPQYVRTLVEDALASTRGRLATPGGLTEEGSSCDIAERLLEMDDNNGAFVEVPEWMI